MRRAGRGLGYIAIALVLLCTCSVAVNAVQRDLRFETLGIGQGLPQETVTAIRQDRQGFMWLGTQGGLVRYDGYRFLLFRGDGSKGDALADNWVQALHEDSSGQFWVGSRGGLQRFDAQTRTFSRFAATVAASRGPGHLDVRAIVDADPAAELSSGAAADPAGRLWIATADGLQRLRPHSAQFELWQHGDDDQNSLASNDVKALAHGAAGVLMVGTAAGLDRLDAASGRIEHVKLAGGDGEDASHKAVLALLRDRDGRLWIGTQGGLEVWQPEQPQSGHRRFGAAEGLPPGPVNTLLQDQAGTIWVGTDAAGLLAWDEEAGRLTALRHRAGDAYSIADDDVSALFQDRSGLLWAGTWGGGVSRTDPSGGGFERFVEFGGEAANRGARKIYAIAGEAADIIWLGSVGGGLHRLDRRSGDTISYRHDPEDPSSLPHDVVQALLIDGSERFWIGTHDGLARLDRDSGKFWRRRLSDDDPALNRIGTMAMSGDVLWLGTDGGLLRYWPEEDRIEVFRHDPSESASLSPGRVRMLLQGDDGTLWVATDGGLDRFESATASFSHFRHQVDVPDSLSHNRITHLFASRAGALWLGTAGGLNRLDSLDAKGGHFARYSTANGLAADPIGAVREDAAGQLWISTTAGISRLQPETGAIRNYSARDGLIEGSYIVGSAHAGADGWMYFGGIGGLTAFRPDAIRDDPGVPQVVITELSQNSRPLRTGQLPAGVELENEGARFPVLRLSHDQAVISLEFAALHYVDPATNRYAYRLEGLDRDWIETDASRRFVTYTNLAPGEYHFRVKAATKNGEWNEQGASLDVVVAPPYWATWWFRSVATVSLLVGLWLLFRFRVRGLTRQRQMLEQQVVTRTAEVVSQKEAIEHAHRNLAVLGEIGREITAQLDSKAVFDTLERHVHALLDATMFGIYLLDEDGQTLSTVSFMEGGVAEPPESIVLSNPTRLAARCARERRELSIELAPGDDSPSHVPGSIVTLSSLFAPLMAGDRLLGVMTIQSPEQHAYGESERLVFRTLSAYGSIALDNAAAYRQLKQTDAQRALYAISDVASSELDLRAMFSAVHEIVGKLMYAENFFVALYDPAKRMLRFPYFADSCDANPPDPDAEIHEDFFTTSLTLALLRGGQSMMGPGDLLLEPLGIPYDPLHGPGSEDWLGVPMRWGGEVRGAVVVQSYDPAKHYSEADRDLLSYVAQHIATGLTRRQAQEELEQQVASRTRELGAANAQLGVANLDLLTEVEERKSGERLQGALFRIAELASTASSMQDFYVAIHAVVSVLLYARNFFIALLTNDKAKFDFVYAVDEYDSAEHFRQREARRGLTEYVVSRGAALLATREQIDALAAAGELETAGSRCVCWLGVPLIEESATLGVIVVQSYSTEIIYTPRDQELLTFVSLHIATALQRRRAQESLVGAYAELKSRVDELRRAQAELIETDTALKLALDERTRNEAALLEAKSGLERSLADIQETRQQVNLLAELSSFLQACPSAEDACLCISQFGPRLFPHSGGIIYLADASGDSWEDRGSWGEQHAGAASTARSLVASRCWALRRGQPYRIDQPAGALCCPHLDDRPAPRHPYVCLPLTAQGKTFGLLLIEYRASSADAQADRRHALAVAMAEQAGLAIANVQLREALLQQSIRDPLTGLYNRRHMQQVLAREIAQCLRNRSPLAVLMIDVDHFKKFNDTFGHPAGDAVLQNVARAIEATFRRSDVTCRFGGEEFTVLLPQTSIAIAEQLANAVLVSVRGLILSHEGRSLDRVTASIGIAQFPDHASSPQSLVEAADAALYLAKTGGRDRAVVCTPMAV